MRMRLFIYPVLLALLPGSVVVRADLYQVADSKGHVYYTDDPTTVAKTKNVTVSSEQTAGDVSSESGTAAIKEQESSAEELKRLEARIGEEEKALEQDRIDILKEKESLGNDRKRATTPEQIRSYNQRIQTYNDRIAGFLRRQSRLEDDRAALKALAVSVATEAAKSEKPTAPLPTGDDAALTKRREAIDTEYETLMVEKEQLEKAAKKAKTIEAKRELNARIADFNKKIKDYATHKDALNADIQEYNKQVVANLTDQTKDMPATVESEPGPDAASDNDENKENEKEFQELRTRIDGEESYLADEYTSLKAEKENLDQKRSSVKTNEEIREYNQNQEKLDARIAEYEKRNEAFKSELADYNSRLKQKYEKQLKKDAGDQPPTDQ